MALATRTVARLGLRANLVLGCAIFAGGTGAMVGTAAATPAWPVALRLSSRGFAVGLVVRPVVTTLLGRLASDRVADANTLFTVVRRVAGTFGIALFVTYGQSHAARFGAQGPVRAQTLAFQSRGGERHRRGARRSRDRPCCHRPPPRAHPSDGPAAGASV